MPICTVSVSISSSGIPHGKNPEYSDLSVSDLQVVSRSGDE